MAEDAVLKYEEFTSFEPDDIGYFSRALTIPRYVALVGEAKWVMYRSNKWEKKFHDYIHEHEGDVGCYRVGAAGERTKVPDWVCDTKAFTKLGDCLGFRYIDHDGYPVDAEARKPLPELYCTPSGECLLVIEDKSRVVAMMWGGALRVEDVGIVG